MESAKTKQSTGMVDMRKKADERGADKEEDYVKDRFVHFNFPHLLPILCWWTQWSSGFHHLRIMKLPLFPFSNGEDSATEAMGAQKQSMPARYLNLLQMHMVAQLTCI